MSQKRALQGGRHRQRLHREWLYRKGRLIDWVWGHINRGSEGVASQKNRERKMVSTASESGCDAYWHCPQLSSSTYGSAVLQFGISVGDGDFFFKGLNERS